MTSPLQARSASRDSGIEKPIAATRNSKTMNIARTVDTGIAVLLGMFPISILTSEFTLVHEFILLEFSDQHLPQIHLILRWLEIVFENFCHKKRFNFIYIITAFMVAT